MHENLIRIKTVAQCLRGLNNPYVFVGGATVSLYSTKNSLAESIRPTDDVDVVIELATYADFSEIEEKLRALGFINDIQSGVICRYTIRGITVDIMQFRINWIWKHKYLFFHFRTSWHRNGKHTSQEAATCAQVVILRTWFMFLKIVKTSMSNFKLLLCR